MRQYLTGVISPGKGNGQQRDEATDAFWLGQMSILKAKTAFFQSSEQQLNDRKPRR